MSPAFNIIVIGAGIAGLSAAIALKDKGHNVTVLERHMQLQTYGGGIGVGPSAARVLDTLDVLDDVHRRCGDLGVSSHSMFLRRWENGEVLFESDFTGGKAVFGYGGFRGRRSNVQRALFEAAMQRGVHIQFGCTVADIDEIHTSVRLGGNEDVFADLIVVADGIASTVRSRLHPDKRQLFSGLDDHMFSVPIAALEGNPKVIPLLNSINFWLGPSGCVVAGPMETDSGPQMSLEFVILGENKGSEGNWNKEIDIDHVRHFFRSWDPVLSEMLAHTEKVHVWRLAYTDPELEWVSNSGKIVLIGDAAHAVLPHTGAGATASIEDGAALAECLARASTTSEISKSTRAFQTIRKPRLTYLQNEGIERASSWHLPDGAAQSIRDSQMKASWTQKPAIWDGKHIDNPPGPTEMALRVPYVAAHDVISFVNKKLDEDF